MPLPQPQGLTLDRDRPEFRLAVARQLLRHSPLEAHDLSALEAALDPVESVASETVLASPGSLQPFAVAEGWVGLIRTAANGHRQILALFLPGDVVGFDTATAPLRQGEIIALVPARIRRISSRGRALIAAKPRLVQALAAHNLQHQALLQDQIFRIGVLSALERVAHLLDELHARLLAVSSDGRCMVPLKQEIIAQVLGISLVHVNRTLQALSLKRLAWFDRGRLVVPDRAALRAAWAGT